MSCRLASLPFEAPDPLAMRKGAGAFQTGVAVVTTCGIGQPHGTTINSLVSISLEPPIFMISLGLGSRTGAAVSETGRFAISILSAAQEAEARKFAAPVGARFEEGCFDATPGGLPVIGDALTQAECKVVQTVDVGDHRLFFGEVEFMRSREGKGLAFLGGHFGTFRDLKHDEVDWL